MPGRAPACAAASIDGPRGSAQAAVSIGATAGNDSRVRPGVCTAGLAIIATMVLLVGGSASAAASPPAYVVMYSDAGDYIGGGIQREFDSSNGQVSVSGTPA